MCGVYFIQPPVQQMAGMTVTAGEGGRRTDQSRGGPPSAERRTRPDHIADKRGTSGQPIALRSNFVTLRNRPNCALYQYNVSYSPPIESRGLRTGLLSEHTSLIGNVPIKRWLMMSPRWYQHSDTTSRR